MLQIISQKIEAAEKNKGNTLSLAKIAKPVEYENKLGEFFSVLDLKIPPQTAAKVAEIIWQIFEQDYYSENSKDRVRQEIKTNVIFEKTVSKVNKALETLAAEGYLKDPVKINACLAVIKDAALHLAYTGDIKVFLLRDQKMIEVTQAETKEKAVKNSKIFQNVISGLVQANDILLMTSPELLNYLSNEKIKRTLFSKNLNEACQELKQILRDTDEVSPYAAVVLKIKAKPVLVEEDEFSGNPLLKNEKKFSYASSTPPNLSFNPEKKTPSNPAADFFTKGKETLSNLFTNFSARKKKPGGIAFPEKSTGHSANRGFNAFGSAASADSTTYQAPRQTPLSTAGFTSPLSRSQKPANKFHALLKKVTDFFKEPGRNKFYVIGALVLILVLIFLITSVSLSRKKKEAAQTQTNYLVEAENREKKAADALIYKDYEKAKTLLAETENLIKSKLEGDDKYKNDVASLKKKIEEDYDKINKINRVSPVLLTELSGDQNFEQLLGFKNNLYSFSKNKVKIFQYSPAEKKFSEFSQGTEGLNQLDLGAYNDQKNSIAFLAGGTFAEMPLYSKKISKLKTEFPEDNHGFAAMAIFGDKIYLLDPANNQIYQHTRTVDGYAKSKPWILEDNPDLKDTVSMAIDGYVYAVKKNGAILKFYRGKLEDFKITGLEKNFSAKTKIFTSAEHEFLYLLDQDQKRIIVLDKKGNYIKDYTLSNVESLSDLYVDSAAKTIYLLAGKKFYEIKE